ncbi:unnamed protein product [Chrysodeixis includens]|uniref:Uncharacterized protein n=1 Tax=Chrysodeixis includens TaxID=689277 RepID=A0A9P0FRE9_CHRIL|nr:unnamed protein product [Chrysodeixis includens]
MLQLCVCIMLVLSVSKCFCAFLAVYPAPCDEKDAFQSTWRIIKSQVPMAHWDLKRSKRTTTTTSTTERSGFIIIPILREPKSRYQDMYRMRPPASRKNALEAVADMRWFRKSNRFFDPTTTTPRPDEDDNSVYKINFKNFKVKFFYNINLDF